MRRRDLILSGLAALSLVAVSVVLVWLAEVMSKGVENYRSKEPQLREIALKIDLAAGLPQAANPSASSLAQLVADANEARANDVRLYRALAALLFFVAIGQFLIVVAAYRRVSRLIERSRRGAP